MPSDPQSHAWPTILSAIVGGELLSTDQATWAFRSILSGSATPAQVGAFALSLRTRGETSPELAALVTEMLEHAHRPWDERLAGKSIVDTCGTGGDRSGTVNISTMAAVVTAACGVHVAKHGNRAASSESGSADVLEALGLPLNLTPNQAVKVLVEAGITFFFAPSVHPALGVVAPIRKELGAPTTFNLLGPLANPLPVTGQVIGIPNPAYGRRYAETLVALGRTRAIVVSSSDGLDEVSPSAPSHIWEVAPGGVITESEFDPACLGITGITLDSLRGGTPARNAALLQETLQGSNNAIATAVALNAAAALRVAAIDHLGWDQAFAQARAAIDDGQAATVLDRWLTTAGRVGNEGESHE